MDRAYSLLTVKAADDEQRTLVGVATTPSVDRVGDVINPLGVTFRNPLPLLWQHRHDAPIGTVVFNKPTKAGVTFRASLPKITEPGMLRDRVDEAWASVKLGLVRAVSVGFRPLGGAIEALESGGVLFKKIEVVELSLVTIPANQDCTVSNLKYLDEAALTKINQVANSATRSDLVPYPRGLDAETRELILAGSVQRRLDAFRRQTPGSAKAGASVLLLMESIMPLMVQLRWQGDRIEELERRLGQ